MTYKNKLSECIKILDDCNNQERQLILNEIISYISKKNEININKLTNGSISENIVCFILGLRWNKEEVHGADCHDENNKKIEIKTFLTPKISSKVKMVNVNYSLPTKKKDETQEIYYERIEKFIDINDGGHIWACLNRDKTDILEHWKLNSTNLSIAIKNKCINHFETKKENLKSLNFGCNSCPSCGSFHRIEIIVELVNKDSILPKKVHQDCYNKPVVYVID